MICQYVNVATIEIRKEKESSHTHIMDLYSFLVYILESFQASNVRLRHSQNEVKTSLAVIYVNTLHKTRGLSSTKYSSKTLQNLLYLFMHIIQQVLKRFIRTFH